jgi:pimeloyl-ACP methyl ester carboxylesterase
MGAHMAEAGEQANVLFFPGASGDGSFWEHVGNRLPTSWCKHYLDWPGLGNQAASPEVNGIRDLVRLAEQRLCQPSAIVAQSMGGVVAVLLALRRPELVTHLVLVATSGGVKVEGFGASDWRPDFLATFPGTARWILTEKSDLTGELPHLKAPTLLIWGGSDPISPVSVGRYIESLIPGSELAIVPGGTHSIASDSPEIVAPMIERHLTAGKRRGAGPDSGYR